MTDPDLAQKVVERCRQELPSPADWRDPGGYPDSLALCVVNAIQSMGVRYGSVENIMKKYKAARPGVAMHDGASELLATFAERGGVDGWAAAIGNGHRVSTKSGAPRKAQVVQQAAEALLDAGVGTTEQLRALSTERLAEVKRLWLALPGQRSGISWRYFLMLADVPGVKADRMICRFVQAASGSASPTITPGEAARAVEDAADTFGVRSNVLDHAIWRWQSGRD